MNNTLYQDEYEEYGIKTSYASITDVEKLQIRGKIFYQLSFDSDFNKDITLDGSIYGEFVTHPKTKIINEVILGSSVIDVDSTVGFPESGTLVYLDSSGNEVLLSYDGKSVTQFYNISGLQSNISPKTDVRLNVFAYGFSGNNGDKVTVRIGNVLDEIKILNDTYYFSKDDTARIKTLGISRRTVRNSNWIDNIANNYLSKSIVEVDSASFIYDLELHVRHTFKAGDKFLATDNSGGSTICEVLDIKDSKTIVTQSASPLNLDSILEISRFIRKVNSSIYPTLNENTADIQNTYTNYNDDVLVASNSLPFYRDQVLDPYDKKINISGNFNGELFTVTSNTDHGFYTGDRIYYSPFRESILDVNTDEENVFTQSVSKFDTLDEGLYYVSRVDSTSFKLAKSPSNIVNNKFASVSGIVTSNTFSYYDFQGKTLQPQNIFREIKKPVDKSETYETNPGKVGILVNGVEVLNHKSSENIFYGQIDNIDVTASGTGYDVINPPSLSIEDSLGIGATGICAVTGSLERIEIIDPGFDYVNTPIINITGGNGNNAVAEVNMIDVDHISPFVTDDASKLNIFTNTIGFSTFHKFRDNEQVIYLSDGQTGVAGLTTDAKYYVSVIDALNIKLHKTEGDSISGINTITITDYGVGIHRFKSVEKKSIISNIIVSNSGEGYTNKQRTTTVSGINTAADIVNINSHGYSTGDEVKYSSSGLSVDGLTSDESYVIKKIDNDSFKIAQVGVGTIGKSFYLDSDQYINLKSVGSGVHSFNYPPIDVKVIGNIGISTLSGQDFSAKIQPIFRGSIDSVHLTANGSEYGSEEVINYNRQPNFALRSGKNAQLLVIVNTQGQIQEVLIVRGGSGYNSPPNLVINGKGKYAQLVPIIENGEIVKVIVKNGGVGYTSGTTVDVIASGQGARMFADIQKWTVNLFQKYFNTIKPDDGVISLSDRNDGGLQYCHLFAPRKLRQSLTAKSADSTNDVPDLVLKSIDDSNLFGVGDLKLANSEEVPSSDHSPIIGWAYDGNPIYGPYGYTTPKGGTARSMQSGYEPVSKPNRPNLTNFPQGFFIEDYEFKGSGDLDKHNGRFCVTPDYPNGVYAYFATISSGLVDTDGPFRGFKRPVFPYLIGNSFKSEPNSFNFKSSSNQKDYKLDKFEWLRNTSNYELKGANSSYEYVYNPTEFEDQTVNIDNIRTGGVDSIGILTGGNNYRPLDSIIFDNGGSGGENAFARVSRVFGKSVNTISVGTTSFVNVEFANINNSGKVIGFTTLPHKFNNFDIANISGLNTSFSKIEGSYNLGIRTDNFITTLGINSVPVTGLTTYFYISGSLEFPNIKENDILGIGTQEKIKVLNIDKKSKRIRVLRQYNSTVGSAYSASTVLYEDPRKFVVNTGFKTDYSFQLNRELYFDPTEAVGVGTGTGVGIGTTISFSLPGIGATQVFVPTQSIYIPEHNVKTGDKIKYSTHGGSEITVSNGNINFALPQTQNLYATALDNNRIGISTVKVGLGTNGEYVGIGTGNAAGLLFFRDFGSGNNHSFTTLNSSIVGELSKNVVTVSTSSTHGLRSGNNIRLTNIPTDEQEVIVKYNDSNRRCTFGEITFTASDVNLFEDSIFIENHGLVKGEKVIYASATPVGGLISDEMYYVDVYTKDKIKLCATKGDLYLSIPNHVNITSASGGTLSLVNPNLKVYKNKTIKFNLSDSSLSSSSGNTDYPAFELNFYRDINYLHKFDGTGKTRFFEVIKSDGKVGVDTSASTTLQINNDFDNTLFYKLDNINEDLISSVKKEILIDTDVHSANKITLIDSRYSGNHRITGIGSTTFTFDLSDYPEKDSYNKLNSNIFYDTKSLSSFGSISSVEIVSKGSKYEVIPGISTIKSDYGSGAILESESKSIGRIAKKTLSNIGFDYPSDPTMSPTLNLPEIIKVESLTSFNSIGITSSGKNYLVAPDLVVIDGFTGKVITDLDLKYELGSTEVDIRKNTFGMYNVEPAIYPINNTNGVGISSITTDYTTKDVVIGIATVFSDNFPFRVGDDILIEHTSVGPNSTGRGYNSSDYDYNLFKVTAINPAFGSNVATITFNLKEYFGATEMPGVFDAAASSGRVIRKGDFPLFTSKLKKNNFIEGENVFTESGSGKVEKWNSKTEYIKISTDKDLTAGEIIIGQTSGTRAVVSKKIDFDSYIKVSPSTKVNKGWIYDAGMLNDSVQRISDNDYYQQFSYALKSRVPIQTWDDPVQSLNHTTGFLKFSDLLIESKEDGQGTAIINPNDASIDVTVDLVGTGNLNCVHTFDLASENSVQIANGTFSNEIKFDNRVLTDYFESVGNRVLTIDDFSDLFSHVPRATKYSIVEEFLLSTARVKKYFTFIRDKRFTGERQMMAVSLLHDNDYGFLNQYGRVESAIDLGSFDFSIFESLGQLRFYPNKFTVNDYDISTVSFNIADNIGITTNVSLGDIVKIESDRGIIPQGGTGPTNVVSIASTYRASKVLVQIGGTDGSYYEFDEINLLHDGTNVDIIEYGQLTDNSIFSAFGIAGLGTYIPRIVGNNVMIDYKLNSPINADLEINAIAVSIASTQSVGVGTDVLTTAEVKSGYVSIASSSSPVETVVSEYLSNHSSAYYVVSVEDTTNNDYEMFEVVVVDDGSTAYFTEFANISTNGTLGQIGAKVAGNATQLTYTANPNIDVEVRVFQNALGLVKDGVTKETIDVSNATITTPGENGLYEGTSKSVRKQFDLTHNQDPIFLRYFAGDSTSTINIDDNSIFLPNHFFTSGEELVYTHAGAGTTMAIGIGSTSIPGIGNTDKLPTTVFVHKVNESKIKLSPTAEDALKLRPNTLEFTSVGIGTSHRFLARNQNSKVLLAIDNYIQSPIVATSVTTSLSKNISSGDTRIEFAGITSFFGGDLIQVNNEIMKISVVGFGSTNSILVQRPWMGTGLTTHSSGDVVTRIEGNYNIVDSTVHFVDAPYGKDPVSSDSNPPLERDWVGITTNSKFQGRTFLRSGVQGSSNETYEDNYIFDDISGEFDGVQKDFRITAEKQDVAGFSTDFGIVLINGIFQGPPSQDEKEQDYTFIDNAGISSISFTGTATSVTYDVNNANIPVGGVIVSVASTQGFGFQPLVSAGGTAVVSAAGTISAIGIGNSGSGYRAGVQTVSVGIQIPDPISTTIIPVGIASIVDGNVNSVAITTDRVFYAPKDISNVTYNNTTGVTTITTSSNHDLLAGDEVIVSGIAFTCNYSGTEAVNVSNAIYDNVSGIMTVTTASAHNLSTTGKNSDVILTGLGFTCNLDNGGSTHVYPRVTDPAYCGSEVLNVISSTKFVINAGVSTVPTFYQSGGTAQPAILAPRSKNNSASGNDPAVDGTVVIRVIDDTSFEINSGISTREHFYARCGKINKPLDVVFDDPISYTNIPLVYSSSSIQGAGRNSTVDIVVGQGSSVVDFSIKNTGYAYGVDEILTVDIGGATGIPTDTTKPYSEFQLTVDKVYKDNFSGWVIGKLDHLDDFSEQFDGVTRSFPLKLNDQFVSIRAAKGSLIDVQATLIVFINDILQVPGESYTFEGGSILTFSEAPDAGDSVKVLFYKGTGDVDVAFRDILETVKVGDTLQLKNEPKLGQNIGLREDARVVTGINTTDSVNTNLYNGPGITNNDILLRPVEWCRQTSDRIIDGEVVGKSRIKYEPLINPSAYAISSVGIGSTTVYLDNVKPFFNPQNESDLRSFQNKVTFTSHDKVRIAVVEATVSVAGTINAIAIDDGGFGYVTAPEVSISNPVGLGTTHRAYATATISPEGVVDAIIITDGGSGYDPDAVAGSSTAPIVLIEPPPLKTEDVNVGTFSGDSGVIVGYGITGEDLTLDLHIPTTSYLRDASISGLAKTVSTLDVNDYFIVYNSNVGSASTSFESLNNANGIIGVSTQFIDSVYFVSNAQDVAVNVPGIGATTVRRVTMKVGVGAFGVDFSIDTESFDSNALEFSSSTTNLNSVGFTTSSFFGNYSWGKIETAGTLNSYNIYNNAGIGGITTSVNVNRTSPLKYINYTS